MLPLHRWLLLLLCSGKAWLSAGFPLSSIPNSNSQRVATSTSLEKVVVGSRRPWRRLNRSTTTTSRRTKSLLFSLSGPQEKKEEPSHTHIPRRRQFLSLSWFTAGAGIASSLLILPESAHACSLIQFPCPSLKNRYHFMRAGLSDLEADGIYSTNPLFLTNRENALTVRGEQAVLDACDTIKASGQFPTVTYHSLAANGMDTGDLMARTLLLGRDRLLPEFTYLDQRGIGLWDSDDETMVKPAVWALDVLEAGRDGFEGRPPAHEDGTPNEVLADQFVRLRQFLSLQESRTSGENILVIFPDGTGPALLSCMIAGIPFRDVHSLEYAPGEIRLDITQQSVLELYKVRKDDPEYLAMIDDGKKKLAELRSQTTSAVTVSLKDQKAEAARREVDEAFRQEQEHKNVLGREKEQHAKREKEQRAEEQQQAQEERRKQVQTVDADTTMTDGKSDMDTSSILAVTALGSVGLAAAAAIMSNHDKKGSDDDNRAAAIGTSPAPTIPGTADVAVSTSTSAIETTTAKDLSMLNDENVPATIGSSPNNGNSTMRGSSALEVVSPTSPSLSSNGESGIRNPENENNPEATDGTIDKELEKLGNARVFLEQDILNGKKNTTGNAIDEELNTLEAAQEAMNSYLDRDDGASDWLQVLAEIRDEPDDDDVKSVNGGTTDSVWTDEFPNNP